MNELKKSEAKFYDDKKKKSKYQEVADFYL